MLEGHGYELLGGDLMKVNQLMTTDVTCVQPTDTIQKAAQEMKTVNCGSIPICENNKVVGMLTDRDIVINAVATGRGADCKCSDCMTTNIISCTPETDAHEAADLMSRHQIRRLPVCDNSGNLVGICSIGDLATVAIHMNEAGDALSRISQPTQGANAIH